MAKGTRRQNRMGVTRKGRPGSTLVPQKGSKSGKPSPIGSPGNPGIGPLRKGELAEFGYANVASLSQGRRHLALGRAVRVYGALSVFRKLNAVYVYTRHTAPVSSAIFKIDRDWVKEYYGF